MSIADTIAQEALVVNAASQWKLSKTLNECNFELSTMTSYDRKGFRVSTVIEPCSVEALDLLFSTPGNNKLFEPAIVSEMTLEEDLDDRSRLVHTKFGQQGVVSARDFITRQSSRLVDKQFSSAVEKILLSESGGGPTAAACGKVFIFATKSTDDADRTVPVSGSVVRGCVHMHAFIGVPLYRSTVSGSPRGGESQPPSAIKLFHISCVDPKGSIPTFALENAWPAENCAKVARIRDLAVLIENLVTNAKRVDRHLQLTTARSPVPAIALLAKDNQRSTAVLTPPTTALPQVLRGSTCLAETPVDVVVIKTPQAVQSSPEPTESKRNRDTMRATLKPLAEGERAGSQSRLQQQQQDSPIEVVEGEIAAAVEEEEDEAILSPAVAQEAQPTITKVIDLFKHNAWVVSKTLENCLLEEMPAPFAPERKVLRISTTFNCSLGTFCEFLADTTQVRKYDPNLEAFDVVSDTPAGVVLYTSYKQQSRLVTPRDFCTVTAKAELNSNDAEAQGLPRCAGAYVQCSVNSSARAPVKQFIRGTVFVFGYVALADRDASIGSSGAGSGGGTGTPSIKVYNIMCVDPSGSIPKWLVDAASADSCKKLAMIRKLCEDRQRSAPGAIPRRLSMRRPPRTASTVVGRGGSQSRLHHEDPNNSNTNNSSPRGTASRDEPLSDTDSSQFHSCVDENEVFNEQENLRGFYEKEVLEVVEHVILLHRAPGWETQKMVNDIRLETMNTSFCDKKAIKIGCEFKCSLETFRTVISSIEYVRKYNNTLNEMEPLDSPAYGTVMYTSYNSTSKLIQPRDFCTLTAARLLSEEEGSDAGLYTKGFRAAAFVISSVNATDKPEQPGYIRGTVHAHGYIAVAVPPDAQRIRVFNVSLIDPMGSIPAKLVDMAVADTVKQIDVIRGICETVHNAGGNPRASAVAASVTALSSNNNDSAFPSIDEVPILRKLARVHVSTPEWRDLRHLGKVQATWAPCDVNPEVPVLRFATEFMCTIDAFARFVGTSDHLRKCDAELDVVKFLNGPPNATISYLSHSAQHKALTSVDIVQMTVTKHFTGEEGSELGLYTKGINASAFVVNAVNWSTKELTAPQTDRGGHTLHRATVLYNGYVAIATPANARRIRVVAYVALAGVSALNQVKPKDGVMSEFANRMTRMAAFCEQVQRDMDAATMVPGGAESSHSGEDIDTIGTGAAVEATTAPPSSTESNKVDDVVASAPAASAVVAVVPRAQLDITAKLIELQRRRDWTMGKVVDRCLLETMTVPFCTKKALRISADFSCSLRTLADFLDDTTQVRVLDPGLDTFDIVSTSDKDKTVNIYTAYQQQVKLISPRDFYTITTRMVLGASEATALAQVASVVPEGHCALVQNSRSIDGHPPAEGKKLVRGIVHVHGFFATAPTLDYPKIRVFNISCVDPSGSIPNWVIEAANAEACKKLALIRSLCEERQRQY
ncbi:Hypothetical protein, putative [Bodo saltans]|uniref:START domain-containing protein n=1 Tax=Bodo saltans TaxID=75058 RepID=A0A0S4JGG7_BODSA|nr:Hypothetical protein, putative [Bodo saltans]|eukprot:CUG89393.1 Hypothetical protein, putative [Bodo saltans]